MSRVRDLALLSFLSSALLPGNVFAGEPEPGRIVVHDGYGTPTSFRLWGRVLEGKAGRSRLALVDNLKALETDEIPQAVVEVDVAGTSYSARTDEDGNWLIAVRNLARPLKVGRVNLTARLTDDRGHPTPETTGVLHILNDTAGVAIISDFDDTVVETGVLELSKLAKNTLLKKASDLKPVPGAAKAYQNAIRSGARGIFYVSGSPQNLNDRIVRFLEIKKVPRGPLLLKNLGDDALMDSTEHKIRRVEELFSAFPKLAFVLVGDSGEKDPEIYRTIKKKHPKRVAAIVIRFVSSSENAPGRFKGMMLVKDYSRNPKVLAEIIGRSKKLK